MTMPIDPATAAILTRIRPCPDGEPLPYSIALRLHASVELDAEYASLDLTTLPPPALRRLLESIEGATGLRGASFNSAPEEGD